MWRMTNPEDLIGARWSFVSCGVARVKHEQTTTLA